VSPATVDCFIHSFVSGTSLSQDGCCGRIDITETEGTLLLRPDRALIASIAEAARSGSETSALASVAVKMELPFANPPRTVTWSVSGSGTKVPSLLQEPEQVLSFGFAGVPTTVNQDVKITVTLPDGKSFTKWRRLMRAPPLLAGSPVLAVQVDHSRSALQVDGRPYAGSGFYYGG